MTSIKNELSTLTTINETVFTKLFDKIVWCICDAVDQSQMKDERVTEVDLDFGKLIISTDNESIKYKFIPSSKLEKAVTDVIVNERNDLKLVIEDALVKKLTDVYKTFF